MARRRNQKNPVEAIFGILVLVIFVAMVNPSFAFFLIFTVPGSDWFHKVKAE